MEQNYDDFNTNPHSLEKKLFNIGMYLSALFKPIG